VTMPHASSLSYAGFLESLQFVFALLFVLLFYHDARIEMLLI